MVSELQLARKSTTPVNEEGVAFGIAMGMALSLYVFASEGGSR